MAKSHTAFGEPKAARGTVRGGIAHLKRWVHRGELAFTCVDRAWRTWERSYWPGLDPCTGRGWCRSRCTYRSMALRYASPSPFESLDCITRSAYSATWRAWVIRRSLPLVATASVVDFGGKQPNLNFQSVIASSTTSRLAPRSPVRDAQRVRGRDARPQARPTPATTAKTLLGSGKLTRARSWSRRANLGDARGWSCCSTCI